MRFDPHHLPDEVLAFLAEPRIASLSTLRPDGSLHVVPVGFTWDNEAHVVRIITFASAVKVKNLRAGGRAAVSQVDGGRWLTLEGPAAVTADAGTVARAVEAYAARYRRPGERPDRVTIEITVDRVMGRA